jgi:hypothetical protein
MPPQPRNKKKTFLEEQQDKANWEKYWTRMKQIPTAQEAKNEWLKKHGRTLPTRKKKAII